MIDTKQFKTLMDARAVSSLDVRGVEGGFIVLVNGNPLEAQRGHVRRFKKPQALLNYLRSMGVAKFDMDLTHWQPEQAGIFE